jgi:hypothetical protein
MRVAAAVAALAVALAVGVAAQNPAAPAAGRGRGGGPQGVRQVTVTAIPGVVAADAKWTLAWQGTDNADGLVGMPDGSLLFAQEQPNRVRRLDANDAASVFVEDTHGAGSLALDAQGRLFAVQRTCTDPGRNGAPCDEPTAVAIIYPIAARKTLATAVDGRAWPGQRSGGGQTRRRLLHVRRRVLHESGGQGVDDWREPPHQRHHVEPRREDALRHQRRHRGGVRHRR